MSVCFGVLAIRTAYMDGSELHSCAYSMDQWVRIERVHSI